MYALFKYIFYTFGSFLIFTNHSIDIKFYILIEFSI